MHDAGLGVSLAPDAGRVATVLPFEDGAEIVAGAPAHNVPVGPRLEADHPKPLSQASMILLRHGQSAFNLYFTRHRRDPGIEDPVLTAEGEAQAEAAARAVAASHRITRIIASPFRRALQTAAPAAALLRLPVLIDPGVRERYAFRCDVGSPPAILARDWPAHDFSILEERWWHENGPEPDGALPMEPEAAVIARAEAFRSRMRNDPEQATTLLVSHWGFLLCLSGRSHENGTWSDFDPSVPLDGPIRWQH